MKIEQVKENWNNGLINLIQAMDESRACGYNMAKIGKSPKTGMGGKWVWFKK